MILSCKLEVRQSHSDENCDPKALKYALGKGAIEYEDFLQSGDPEYAWKPPEDEWQSIALGYTSGTTASPKGVSMHTQDHHFEENPHIQWLLCPEHI